MTLTFPNFKKEVENIFGRLDPWNIAGRSDPWNSYKAYKDLTTKWQALIQKAQETCGLYYQTKLHLQWGATTENQWVRDTIWFRVKDAKNLILSAKEKTPKLMPKPCYSQLADSDISKLVDFHNSNWGKLITVIQLYTERHYALLPHPQRESSLSQELNILSFKEKGIIPIIIDYQRDLLPVEADVRDEDLRILREIEEHCDLLPKNKREIFLFEELNIPPFTEKGITSIIIEYQRDLLPGEADVRDEDLQIVRDMRS